MLYCMFVDIWTPVEISLTTLRVILGVCLNKVIIIIKLPQSFQGIECEYLTVQLSVSSHCHGD